MPPESKIKKLIPTLYKRDALSHLLFGHINAVRYNISGATIEQAVEQFKKYYNLSEDEYPTQTAVRTYHTMTKELHELARKK